MTTAAPAVTTAPAARFSIGSSLKAGLIGALVGAVGCYLLYGLARVVGVEFIGAFNGPDAPIGPLPLPAIFFANLVPGLVASFVFFGFTRVLRAPQTPWLITSAVLAAASAIPPLALAGASTGTRVTLAAMHFIAGFCIAGNLARASK